MWVGAILLTSILFSFNASTGCLDLLALVQKSGKSGRVAKKWPEERSGEHVRIFFKYLSSPPTTSLSSRKTVPRVKISNVKMSKCQNMRCRMVSHPSYIQTYSHSHTHTHIHTLIYTYIHKYSTRPLFVYLTRSMILYRSKRVSLIGRVIQMQGA